MKQNNKSLGKWTLTFLLILILPFVIIVAIPLLLGFPSTYLPILVALGAMVIAVLYKKFLKKD